MRFCPTILKIRRISAKFVPKRLTTDQMECRMMVAVVLFEKKYAGPNVSHKDPHR